MTQESPEEAHAISHRSVNQMSRQPDRQREVSAFCGFTTTRLAGLLPGEVNAECLISVMQRARTPYSCLASGWKTIHQTVAFFVRHASTQIDENRIFSPREGVVHHPSATIKT